MAHKLGITTHLDGFPAEGIGGLRLGVTPLEKADAYATFADGGVHHDRRPRSPRSSSPTDTSDEPERGPSEAGDLRRDRL